MEFTLEQLATFLIRAKKQTYAGEGKEIVPQRPGFKELEFVDGHFEYRDSYIGFYKAPGQEIVRYKGKPVWVMSYNGGMKEKYHKDEDLAMQIFGFLKKCLNQVEESEPFRGPKYFKEGDYEYINEVYGNIKEFKGQEKILFKGEEIFRQEYIGGLVVLKN